MTEALRFGKLQPQRLSRGHFLMGAQIKRTLIVTLVGLAVTILS
jgi:hypothetical protein